jgi:hypothetical protein
VIEYDEQALVKTGRDEPDFEPDLICIEEFLKTVSHNLKVQYRSHKALLLLCIQSICLEVISFSIRFNNANVSR